MSDKEYPRCPACRRLYTPASARSRTCGRPECQYEWATHLRYHDPEAGRKHREAKARYVLKHAANYGEERIRSAHRILTEGNADV